MHAEKPGVARMVLLVVMTVPPVLVAILFLGASLYTGAGTALLPIAIGAVLVAPTIRAWAIFRRRPNLGLLIQAVPLLVSGALIGLLIVDPGSHK